MKELYEQIDRFQKLKELTSTSKSSSYCVQFHFDPWDDMINIEWGCYDVGSYPRHYYTKCKRDELVEHMSAEINKMELVVKQELNKES